MKTAVLQAIIEKRAFCPVREPLTKFEASLLHHMGVSK